MDTLYLGVVSEKKNPIFVVIVQISLTSYPPYPNLDTKLVDNVTVISNPPSHKKFGQNLSDFFGILLLNNINYLEFLKK